MKLKKIIKKKQLKYTYVYNCVMFVQCLYKYFNIKECLYISLHGGGGCHKSINDKQYQNQKILYDIVMKEIKGVYMVLIVCMHILVVSLFCFCKNCCF